MLLSKMHRLAAGLFCLGFVSPAFAQNLPAFFCVVEKATGFKYDVKLKEWRATNFVADQKFIIIRPPADKRMSISWVVKEFGGEFEKLGLDTQIAICENDFNKAGIIFCDGSGIEFNFNRNHLRFTKFNLTGYYSSGTGSGLFASDEGSDTPAIFIGTCSDISD